MLEPQIIRIRYFSGDTGSNYFFSWYFFCTDNWSSCTLVEKIRIDQFANAMWGLVCDTSKDSFWCDINTTFWISEWSTRSIGFQNCLPRCSDFYLLLSWIALCRTTLKVAKTTDAKVTRRLQQPQIKPEELSWLSLDQDKHMRKIETQLRPIAIITSRKEIAI